MPPGFSFPEGEMAAWLALTCGRATRPIAPTAISFTVARLAPA